MASRAEPLGWDADLPLFSRVMLTQWTGAMLATLLLVALIMAPIFLVDGDLDALGRLMVMMAVCVAVLWAFGLLLMALLFRGRFRVRFTVDRKGIRFESREGTAAKLNRAAVVIGALAAKPGLAGAGLLAASREAEEVRWSPAVRIVYRPRSGTILVRNSWRTLMWVHCPAEVYDRAAAAIQEHSAAASAAAPGASRSPLPRYLGHTLLVAVASFALFAAADEFGVDLLVPLSIYCFALAMVWLVPLFGYVVLAGLLLQAGLTTGDLWEVRESSLFVGETYRGYEVLGDAETGLLLVTAVAASGLALMSWRYLRGRSVSALVADHGDMGG